jgi:hypothetical protein
LGKILKIVGSQCPCGGLSNQSNCWLSMFYTDKKENKIFLVNKEIQRGAVAKSYMTKGLLIYY